jgi:transcriptional regulator with XRE-family HTH domain
VDQATMGRELRSARAAAGRTVASVAQDAGLSVPYVANLENGRGNPTVTALSRLAGALGLDLTIGLGPASDDDQQVMSPPASLVRLGRTPRFRRVVQVMAGAAGRAEAELSVQLVGALTALAGVVARDLAEPDWWRLLDALLLIAAYPQADG